MIHVASGNIALHRAFSPLFVQMMTTSQEDEGDGEGGCSHGNRRSFNYRRRPLWLPPARRDRKEREREKWAASSSSSSMRRQAMCEEGGLRSAHTHTCCRPAGIRGGRGGNSS